jgi:hypothetical protein
MKTILTKIRNLFQRGNFEFWSEAARDTEGASK